MSMPPTFSADSLLNFLLERKVASLPDLKLVLGSNVSMTVFRKLKQLSYITSYSHRGAFYSLPQLATFNDFGIWSVGDIHFSRHGTLIDTLEALISHAPQGLLSSEMAAIVHVDVKQPLLALTEQQRVSRLLVNAHYLYLATVPAVRQRQLQARRALVRPAPHQSSAFDPDMLSDEQRTLFLAFFSLLNERQRRLWAGLESARIGTGGDAKIARLVGLDPHTVANGRAEMLSMEFDSSRLRRKGAGRKRIEKKP